MSETLSPAPSYEADLLAGAIEALLFVSDEPVAASTLCAMLEAAPSEVAAALEELEVRLASRGSGILLREVAGGWRLFTHPRYHDLIERYVLSWDTRRLSQAALETLAVVAYLQPATRAQIASVRGVNSDSPVNSLVEKGLIREAGKDLESPGQPVLYVTTKTFLEKFGLASAADLPDIAQFAPDARTRELIEERLGVSRSRDVSASAAFRVGGYDDDEAGFSSGFSQGYEDFTFEGEDGHGR